MPRLLCLVVLALALAVPTAALAQDNPFSPLPQAESTETAVPTVTPAADGDQDGTATSTIILIGGGLVALFAAITTVIVRDARRRVPEAERTAHLREEGPHRHQRRAKAKTRAKGRAARRARKRTTRNR